MTSGSSEPRAALSAPRMVGLETACEILSDRGGIKHVAELIGCSERALYGKRMGDITITDLEVLLIAKELARAAERCARVSANLFNAIGRDPAGNPLPRTAGAST